MPTAASDKTAKKTARKAARRQTLTDLRRAEIIAAALKVFARKGFHATRAEDVAAEAEIAKGTLYLYFDSKEAIYEAALAHAMQSLRTLLDQRLQTAAGVRDQVYVYIAARLEFWGAQGELYRMVLTVGREKPQRKRTAAILSDSVEHLVEILRAGVKRRELRKLPLEPIAWAVMDMIRGAIERRIDRRATTSPEDDATLITDVAMRYFTAN